MRQRISFFELVTSIEKDRIVNSLLRMRYTGKEESGFILGRVRTNTIEAKHVYKFIRLNEHIDPFGYSVKREVEDYYVNSFEISQGVIRIKDSAKSLLHFRKDLILALSGKCVITGIRINLKEFIEVMPKLLRSYTYVSYIEVISKSVIRNSTLNLAISSNNNAMGKLNSFIEYGEGDIKKVIFNVEGVAEIEFGAKGTIKILKGDIDKDDIELIIKYFMSCKLKS